MASMSDILTTAQNIAQAINGVAQTYLNVQGGINKADISTATLLKSEAGRVASVIVTTAGSAPGAVYDGKLATVTTNKLFVIPNTTGIYVVNMPANYGIVIAPGTGQVVAVGYS